MKYKIGPLLFLTPCLAILLFFAVFPLVYSLALSFNSWEWTGKPGVGWEFVGLQNYEMLISDMRFWLALRNTFTIVFFGLLLQFVIGLGLALLLNREIKGGRFYRVAFLLPLMVTPVVAAFLWRLMLHETRGPVNHLLGLLGLPPIGWLSNMPFPLITIMTVDTWQYTPLVMLILLAGLQSIPIDSYEAALIDGAGRWQIFRHVTLPLLKPLILVAVMIRAIDVIKIFDPVVVLTYGGPGYATETGSFYIYTMAFRHFSMGYSSALSYVFLIITVLVSMQLIRGIARGS